MSTTRQSILRGGTRAVVGAGIIAAAVVTVVTVSTVNLPSVSTATGPVTVDVRTETQHDVVCPGSFAVLGADADRSTVAVPTGTVQRVVSGDPLNSVDLAGEEPGGSAPTTYVTDTETAVAAAQEQTINEFGVRGRAAVACVTPANEQWLVGGVTTLGTTTTLVLNNPASVPATVGIRVFDVDGQVDSTRTSGVLVSPQSQRTVSLNGYAPAREQLAVRIESSGAAVTASLNVSAVSELEAFAAESVTRQLAATPTLFIPGVANISDQEHGPGDAGELDRYSVRVRVIAPDGATGTARAYAVTATGERSEIATLEYSGSAVSEAPVAIWPESAQGVVIEADHPIVGGVLGSVDSDGMHDYSWFTPAPELATDREVQVPVVDGGQLVVMNPTERAANVTLTNAGGQSRTSKIPAGAAVVVPGSGAVTVSSAEMLHAAVRVSGTGTLGSYPVTGLIERTEPFEVFTRSTFTPAA